MSEEYQVIARKYRPMCFADVVGQEHVTRTLMNAIRQNRTAHAYLLVGPRGVGKTTLARIFAKALNCENPQDGEPCCHCPSCISIANENSLDVIEIDAASRNSVDDMRDLTDEIMHMPVASRYKIYIIDEIHMLSNQAWNALLKTVEEPPAHVKFIFATTEVHKVLPTIISRCQRFDLLPIPTRLIVERLKMIAKDQQIEIDDSAVGAIARAAEGGMRDAQSLLDQVIAFFSTGKGSHVIKGDDVLSLFGLTDGAEVDRLMAAILGNQPGQVVSIIHRLAAKGKNLETLYEDLLAVLRGVQITQLLENPADILDESAETLARYRKMAGMTGRDSVQILMETIAPVGRMLRDALNKQIFIETILLKGMREAHAYKLEDLIRRLNQLRKAGELQFVEQLPALSAQPLQTPPAAPVVTEAVEKQAVEVVEAIEAAEAAEAAAEPEVAAEVQEAPPVMGEPLADEPPVNRFEAVEPPIEDEEIAPEPASELVQEETIEDQPLAEVVAEMPAEEKKSIRLEQQKVREDLQNENTPLSPAPSRRSIVNEPNAKVDAGKDAHVQELLSLFGGDIVDIHVEKNDKDHQQ